MKNIILSLILAGVTATLTWFLTKETYYNTGYENGVSVTVDAAAELLDKETIKAFQMGVEKSINDMNELMIDVCEDGIPFNLVEEGPIHYCVSKDTLEMMRQMRINQHNKPIIQYHTSN